MKYLCLTVMLLLSAFIVLCFHLDILSKALVAKSKTAALKNTLAATQNTQVLLQNTLSYTGDAYRFALQHHYNISFCLLADMSIASGKNRLFIYSFSQQRIISAALVAHGSCNNAFLAKARFSNAVGCGCSAYGKYKIGGKYNGRFGIAYKLYGLDSSNSNAYERNIVLHSYDGVPEKETYPMPVCNSLGCIMVSKKFLKAAVQKIDASRQPVLLWVFY